MPRPNEPRAMFSEAGLARRIAFEREQRGMSLEGLARRMRDVGCPIQPSAIYKIEKGAPPRRITVDEAVAFAQVFEVPLEHLLLPPEIAIDESLAEAAMYLRDAEREVRAAQHEYEAQLRDFEKLQKMRKQVTTRGKRQAEA